MEVGWRCRASPEANVVIAPAPIASAPAATSRRLSGLGLNTPTRRASTTTARPMPTPIGANWAGSHEIGPYVEVVPVRSQPSRTARPTPMRAAMPFNSRATARRGSSPSRRTTRDHAGASSPAVAMTASSHPTVNPSIGPRERGSRKASMVTASCRGPPSRPTIAPATATVNHHTGITRRAAVHHH